MSLQLDDLDHEGKVEELLKRILIELQISNAYNALGHDEVITEDDLEAEK